MAGKFSTYDILTTYDTDFNLFGYRTDITDATSNCSMNFNTLVSLTAEKMDVEDMDLTAEIGYDTNLYFIGSDGTDNRSMTLDVLIAVLTADNNGLNLDSMFDSNGDQLLSGGKADHISDASTAHAVTTFAETDTALNSLGSKINDILDKLEGIGLVKTS